MLFKYSFLILKDSIFNFWFFFFMMIIEKFFHFLCQNFKIFVNLQFKITNFLWLSTLNFRIKYFNIFSDFFNWVINLLLSEFRKISFQNADLFSCVFFNSFWKGWKLLKFFRLTAFRRLFNCHHSELIFDSEKMFYLEDKLVKSSFLSVNWYKPLTLNFIICLTHFCNQKVEHDNQHKEEVEKPKCPNDKFGIRFCSFMF